MEASKVSFHSTPSYPIAVDKIMEKRTCVQCRNSLVSFTILYGQTPTYTKLNETLFSSKFSHKFTGHFKCAFRLGKLWFNKGFITFCGIFHQFWIERNFKNLLNCNLQRQKALDFKKKLWICEKILIKRVFHSILCRN